MCLCSVVLSGCGNYKQELQTAKQEIDRISTENKTLLQTVSRLQQEKSGLTDEISRLRDANQALTSENERLTKDRSKVARQNAELESASKALEKDLASLKQQKAELQRQVEELKQAVSVSAERERPSTAEAMPPPGSGLVRPSPEQQAKLGPCDFLIEYMKKVESIFRRATGDERAKLIENLRKEYESRISGAPKKARIAAEAWTSEMTRSWDKPRDDSVSLLIEKRNAVLKSCDKDATQAGF